MVYDLLGKADYVFLALAALWGTVCVILVWNRVNAKRFKTEDEQDRFLDSIEPQLVQGNFDAALQSCESDNRALPTMISLALNNRELGYAKTRQLIMDRFQRDIIADLDQRISWISTVIKIAPLLGLMGTVAGMMGAFATLAEATTVEPSKLALDIRIALETTLIGLTITVPLLISMASINNRIKHMEELVAAGLTRFLEAYKIGLTRTSGRSGR
ncbi:MAG: MotA/TolQ/ExbB proton channel family protein [Candidatus Moraniibacteriota bacterium]|nr:MAG: MotA/TolQ/ExbB proton channel family protein [Candidatus Moranbacteria bacterium]